MRILNYAAILGAGLWIITEFMEIASPTGSTSLSLWLTSLWHPILALGIWGLHRNQSRSSNLLSMIGAVCLIISFLGFAPASIMMANSDITTFPEFLEENPVFRFAGLFSLVGYILFGISLIRTRFYPRWVGFALIAAILLGLAQTFGHLPEIVQHVTFVAISLVFMVMALFGLRHLTTG